MKTVNDIYQYNKDNNSKMLSDFPSTFWEEYRTNFTRYDRVFRRMFLTFRYCFQSEQDDTQSVADNFREDVYDHLLINSKKYEELYRVHVLPDIEYSLTDNYNVTETMDKQIIDTNENQYGSRTDNVSETEGDRTDSSTLNVGEQETDTVHKVSPYDSSDFHNNTEDIETKGEREDTESFVKGIQLNTAQNVKGAQLDDLERTYNEDYTLHRRGNIGVMTVSDMLKKHKEFWTLWEFYEYIFKEICAELLLV